MCRLHNLRKYKIGSIINGDEGLFQAEIAGTCVSHFCAHKESYAGQTWVEPRHTQPCNLPKEAGSSSSS